MAIIALLFLFAFFDSGFLAPRRCDVSLTPVGERSLSSCKQRCFLETTPDMLCVGEIFDPEKEECNLILLLRKCMERAVNLIRNRIKIGRKPKKLLTFVEPDGKVLSEHDVFNPDEVERKEN